MNHLRFISVHIKEPDPGDFHWVLMESTKATNVWKELEASSTPFGTWLAAMDDGVARMMFYADDLARGPMTVGGDLPMGSTGSG